MKQVLRYKDIPLYDTHKFKFFQLRKKVYLHFVGFRKVQELEKYISSIRIYQTKLIYLKKILNNWNSKIKTLKKSRVEKKQTEKKALQMKNGTVFELRLKKIYKFP